MPAAPPVAVAAATPRRPRALSNPPSPSRRLRCPRRAGKQARASVAAVAVAVARATPRSNWPSPSRRLHCPPRRGQKAPRRCRLRRLRSRFAVAADGPEFAVELAVAVPVAARAGPSGIELARAESPPVAFATATDGPLAGVNERANAIADPPLWPPANSLSAAPPPVAVAFAELPLEETASADALAAPPVPAPPSPAVLHRRPWRSPMRWPSRHSSPSPWRLRSRFLRRPADRRRPRLRRGRQRRSRSNWRRRQGRSRPRWTTPSRFRLVLRIARSTDPKPASPPVAAAEALTLPLTVALVAFVVAVASPPGAGLPKTSRRRPPRRSRWRSDCRRSTTMDCRRVSVLEASPPDPPTKPAAPPAPPIADCVRLSAPVVPPPIALVGLPLVSSVTLAPFPP